MAPQSDVAAVQSSVFMSSSSPNSHASESRTCVSTTSSITSVHNATNQSQPQWNCHPQTMKLAKAGHPLNSCHHHQPHLHSPLFPHLFQYDIWNGPSRCWRENSCHRKHKQGIGRKRCGSTVRSGVRCFLLGTQDFLKQSGKEEHMIRTSIHPFSGIPVKWVLFPWVLPKVTSGKSRLL